MVLGLEERDVVLRSWLGMARCASRERKKLELTLEDEVGADRLRVK